MKVLNSQLCPLLVTPLGLLEQSSKAKTEGKVIPTLPSVGVVDEEKMR